MSDSDRTEGGAENEAPSLADQLAEAYDNSETDSGSVEVSSEHDDDATEGDDEVAQEESGDQQSAQAERSDEESETESGEAEKVSPIEAPKHWSSDDRAMFASLDKSGQEFLLRRHKDMEADYQRKIQDAAEVRNVLEPFREKFAAANVREGQVIRQLIQNHQAMASNPLGYAVRLAQNSIKSPDVARQVIQHIAQQHGIDLESSGFDTSDDELDPGTRKVLERVNQLENAFQTRQQTEQTTQQQQIQQTIEEFRNATNDDGTLVHPHFEKVRAHMGALMQSGAAADLDAAYSQAVWAVPELRESLLNQQTEEAQKKASEEKRKKAAAAKRRVLPKGESRDKSKVKETHKDWGSALNATWDQLAT